MQNLECRLTEDYDEENGDNDDNSGDAYENISKSLCTCQIPLLSDRSGYGRNEEELADAVDAMEAETDTEDAWAAPPPPEGQVSKTKFFCSRMVLREGGREGS